MPHPCRPGRHIVLVTDPPHLIKNGRNNLEKSYGGTGKFCMGLGQYLRWVRACVIAEQHVSIVRYPDLPLVPLHVGKGGKNTAEMRWWSDTAEAWLQLRWPDVCALQRYDSRKEPTIMPKVNEAHVKLSSWTRMRCHLCTELLVGLWNLCTWVTGEMWKEDKDGGEAPPDAIVTAATSLLPYVDLLLSTHVALHSPTPITDEQDPLLLQLLRNASAVHAWGERLNAAVEAGDIQLPPGSGKGKGRVGLSYQTHRAFQVGVANLIVWGGVQVFGLAVMAFSECRMGHGTGCNLVA